MYSAAGATHDNVWNWMARADHQINANNTWAVRWLRESLPQSDQFTSTTFTRSRVEQENDVDWTVVGTWNSVIAHTNVNVLKLSYTHEDGRGAIVRALTLALKLAIPSHFASGSAAGTSSLDAA